MLRYHGPISCSIIGDRAVSQIDIRSKSEQRDTPKRLPIHLWNGYFGYAMLFKVEQGVLSSAVGPIWPQVISFGKVPGKEVAS
jgi:hypothetical protein